MGVGAEGGLGQSLGRGLKDTSILARRKTRARKWTWP